jgi:hypothetical protein
MSLLTNGRTLRDGRSAYTANWSVRAIVARAARVAAASIKEGREIVVAIAGTLAIVVGGLALDVWIWIPRLGH